MGSANTSQWKEALSKGAKENGRIVFNGFGKVLELDGGDGCTTM